MADETTIRRTRRGIQKWAIQHGRPPRMREWDTARTSVTGRTYSAGRIAELHPGAWAGLMVDLGVAAPMIPGPPVADLLRGEARRRGVGFPELAEIVAPSTDMTPHGVERAWYRWEFGGDADERMVDEHLCALGLHLWEIEVAATSTTDRMAA